MKDLLKLTIITDNDPIIEKEDNHILVTATTSPTSIIDQLIGHYGYEKLMQVLDERTSSNKHIIYYLHKGLTIDKIYEALDHNGLPHDRYYIEPIRQINPGYVKIFFYDDEDLNKAKEINI